MGGSSHCNKVSLCIKYNLITFFLDEDRAIWSVVISGNSTGLLSLYDEYGIPEH